MTKLEAAYIAGLIDGEGSIRISLEKSGKPGFFTVRTMVSIGLTNQNAILWLRTMTSHQGKAIYRSNDQHPRRKPLYLLFWCGYQADELLRLILPYLKIKLRQAEIVLEWRKFVAKNQHKLTGGRNGRAYPQWVIEKRNALLAECRELNRRGKQIPSVEISGLLAEA